jgi:hypothetical protein
VLGVIIFCKLLELGKRKQNITAVNAGKSWWLVQKLRNGEEFLQIRNDVEAALRDTGVY